MEMLTVNVKRFDPESRSFVQESHQVPFEEGMTVLNALEFLFEEKGVHFRHSCDVGICAICMVRVNGKNRLACKEMIKSPKEELTIEPFEKFSPIRDLVVSLKP